MKTYNPKLKTLIILLAVFFAMLCFTKISQAASYYVSQADGNDTYNGLYATHESGSNGPWKTVAKATTVLVAGDTVYIRTGTYNERVFLTTGNSGTFGSRITYKNYPGESPIMDGTGFWWGSSFISGLNATPAGVVHYITFDGLEIRNYPEHGIEFARSQANEVGSTGSHGITVIRCKLHNNGLYGVYIEGGDVAIGGEGYGHLVTLNESYSNHGHNIKFQGGTPRVLNHLQIRDSEISWNTCHDSIGDTEGVADGIKVSTGNHDLLIAHNNCYNNYTGGIVLYETWNCTVEYNESSGNGTNGTSDQQGIMLFYPSNHIVRYNYVHNNPGAGIQTSGVLGGSPTASFIYYNLIKENGTNTSYTYNGGICVGSTTIANIYNNVFFNNTTAGIYVPEGINHVIKNNIFYSVGAGRAGDYLIHVATTGGWTANKINNNCYYTTDLTIPWRWGTNYYTTFATWKSGSSMDTNSLNADPVFTAPGTDFNLRSSSTCINAGADVDLTPDYAGTPVPQGAAPDIGAYEYLSTAPPTPYCGDGSCNGSETCSSCSSDCGVCPDTTPPAAPTGVAIN